jgi:hypothetical protein
MKLTKRGKTDQTKRSFLLNNKLIREEFSLLREHKPHNGDAVAIEEKSLGGDKY